MKLASAPIVITIEWYQRPAPNIEGLRRALVAGREKGLLSTITFYQHNNKKGP